MSFIHSAVSSHHQSSFCEVQIYELMNCVLRDWNVQSHVCVYVNLGIPIRTEIVHSPSCYKNVYIGGSSNVNQDILF